MGATKAQKAAGWLQAPLWEPELTWKPTPVSQLPAWTDAKRVCVDVDLGPVVGLVRLGSDGPAKHLLGQCAVASERDRPHDRRRVHLGVREFG